MSLISICDILFFFYFLIVTLFRSEIYDESQHMKQNMKQKRSQSLKLHISNMDAIEEVGNENIAALETYNKLRAASLSLSTSSRRF